jgi:hypothetical protein
LVVAMQDAKLLPLLPVEVLALFLSPPRLALPLEK